MGLKFRKLRSRLSSSWSVVRSKLTASTNSPNPAETHVHEKQARDIAAEWQRDSRETQDRGDMESLERGGGGEGAESLQWNESRRTYSEPVGVICRTSIASQDSTVGCNLGLSAHECECELEDLDDVFVAERSESWKESHSWEVEKGIALEDFGSSSEVVRFSTGALEDWIIRADELVLGAVLSRSEQETTYRGYWHGNVCVRTRSRTGAEDFGVFLEEVSTLSCIRHENIQLFMGVCLDMSGGALGIVMSEVKGETLHTRLHKYGHNFTTPSKLKILKQITEGMEYLHAKGIHHGSLSTRCVHLHSRVCISISPHVESKRLVRPAHLASLPPELMRHVYLEEGGRTMALDCRPTYPEDVFAFGTMVYELMTLQRPYHSLPTETVIWRVGMGECQSLALVQKGRLKTIISRCWAENPLSRPSFKDLLITLEQNAVFSSTTRLKPSLSLPSIPSELSHSL